MGFCGGLGRCKGCLVYTCDAAVDPADVDHAADQKRGVKVGWRGRSKNRMTHDAPTENNRLGIYNKLIYRNYNEHIEL